MPEVWSSSSIDLHVDVASGGARRSSLEDALRRSVRDGRLAPGTRLPSTRALAHELGLARGTVTAAYNQLAEEGHLITRPGSGTRVAPTPGPPPHAAAAQQPGTRAPRTAPAPTAAGAGIPGAPEPTHMLRPGLPDISAFPTRAWLAATRRVLTQRRPEDVLDCGSAQGRPELRAALADYLGRTRGVRTTPDHIVVTTGYQQSVTLLAQALRAAGADTAGWEDPGHNHFRTTVERAGLRTAPLPVDDQGARPDALTGQVHAAFVTPAHQYPTGVPLHPKRRQALSGWARTHGSLIVEDDYDGEFRYDRQPVGALQGIAPDVVAYCGTASKSLAPALRLAWLVLPPHLVPGVVAAKAETDGYTETLGQLVLAELITTHAYDRHIRACRLRYRRRREHLLDRLAAFPDLTPHGVPAGLHALVTLPAHQRAADEQALLDAADHAGIALRGLSELHHPATYVPDRSAAGLLIGYAAPSEHRFPAAVDALCGLLDGQGYRRRHSD
ncbi:PLP-dependent aminotransferase family protein [Yinghuangia seranimata]|uniref:MocR-like pyridoxine biosynthesis transcription factor PdxR n=1 Tax=Yinghuangia seranimata TaxID=408067 RepID=UPI00248AA22D|nr:PLP-dependent aminotransferase family protein [Yinghuangia seranimata]MDI2131852.1 PLP-dependent aminotransferase family protein [Yinghuangia seranimata]